MEVKCTIKVTKKQYNEQEKEVVENGSNNTTQHKN